MGVQLTYIMIQDRKTVNNKDFHKYQLYGIEGYTLIFFYQGVYDLQILHTASLVGQYWEKIITMGVQLTYTTIQD